MAQKTNGRLKAKAKSLPQALRHFLTPAVWKQAHRWVRGNSRPSRWSIQPLLLTLLFSAWCTGDSQAERFETARGFCIVCRPRQRRPGKSLSGFQMALARLPMVVLRALANGIRKQLLRWLPMATNDFIVLGCDGTRLSCPRTRELERHLSWSSKNHATPGIWLTAIVHLTTGVPWCWRWGKGTANEREHLLAMVPLLPVAALLVADAGYIGFEMASALNQRVSFLIRLNSSAPLYTDENVQLESFREGEFWYWTKEAQQQEKAPLRVRVFCIRGKQKGTRKRHDVWLITNVLDRERLRIEQASRYYRWRWENEGLFRTYKRTLKKLKLESRTVKLVHREAEGSMLALQLLLAQGAMAMPSRSSQSRRMASPRKVLMEIRREMNSAAPKRRQRYGKRLRQAQRECRQRTTPKEKRVWASRTPHKPPKQPKILKLTDEGKAAINQLQRKIA